MWLDSSPHSQPMSFICNDLLSILWQRILENVQWGSASHFVRKEEFHFCVSELNHCDILLPPVNFKYDSPSNVWWSPPQQTIGDDHQHTQMGMACHQPIYKVCSERHLTEKMWWKQDIILTGLFEIFPWDVVHNLPLLFFCLDKIFTILHYLRRNRRVTSISKLE